MSRYIGVDLGRKHDSTAIVIIDVGEDRRTVRVVGVRELKGVPFEGQIADIKRLVKKHDARLVAVDSTGMGLPVSETLQRELAGIVEAVSFTAPSKAELVTRCVSLLQDGRLRLPKHDKLRDQLHSIARELTTSGNILYRTVASDSPDLAWALTLAVHAARNQLLGGEPEIGFILVDSDSHRVVDLTPKRATAQASPTASGYPVVHRNCGLYEDVVEYEDHLRLGAFIREDGVIQGGEVHDKRGWLRQHGSFPWG